MEYVSSVGHQTNNHFGKLVEGNHIDMNTTVPSMQESWSSKC